MLNITVGTFSQWYDEVPFSEVNLGNFPASIKFQCWKVNFRTEVCLGTADPQISMLWIKEVEIAKSIDEHMTSRSIVGRTDFPDSNMLDSMIASALKQLLNTQMHFRKRVSVEEQRAPNHNRFIRGRQIAYMICEYSRATRAYEAVPGLSDLFTISLQSDDVQDFAVGWDHALLSVSEMPSDALLEGLYKSRLQTSAQLRTVLALDDQEIARDKRKAGLFTIRDSCKTSS